MSLALRIFLIACAAIAFVIVLRLAKRSRLQSSDTIFWIVLAFCFVLIAVFPGIAYFFSDLLGFEAPSNFVFVVVIGLLLVKNLSMSVKVSQLKAKTVELAQHVALCEKDRDESSPSGRR